MTGTIALQSGARGAGVERGLDVRGLRVDHLASGLPIVDDVSFTVAPGRVLGIVGESGSGKTTVAMALLGYARPGGRIVAGQVEIGGVDIVALSNVERRRLRGSMTSYVGQDPGASLDPGKRIGHQMQELLETHALGPDEARLRITEYLARVALPVDAGFVRRYPHQLSGGQIQRVLLAMALAVNPTLVVLDEPTTSLDVKVQQDVLQVIQELRIDGGSAVVYVTHDLAVVSQIADDIAVMYGGKIVEQAAASQIFADPRHPYTVQLLRSVPRITTTRQVLEEIPGTAVGILNRPAGCAFAPRCSVRLDRCGVEMPLLTPAGQKRLARCFNPGAEIGRRTHLLDEVSADDAQSQSELLRVIGLSAWFSSERPVASRLARRDVEATRHVVVHDVSLGIRENECLGIVGESGSGKTTLARCIVGLHPARTGDIVLGSDRLGLSARERSSNQQRDIQIVFQNPNASLNPRMTVFGNLEYVIRRLGGVDRRRERKIVATELLALVRMPPVMLERYPRELSGGEKQRVAIARALAARPKLLLCDEITSALDVSVQAAIVGLIEQLREEMDNLTVLFISHDLAVVRAVADQIVVMQHGRIVEKGAPETILIRPSADYTRELIEAIPRMPGDERS